MSIAGHALFRVRKPVETRSVCPVGYSPSEDSHALYKAFLLYGRFVTFPHFEYSPSKSLRESVRFPRLGDDDILLLRFRRLTSATLLPFDSDAVCVLCRLPACRPGCGICHEERLQTGHRIGRTSSALFVSDPFRHVACGLDMLSACRTVSSNVHARRRRSRDRSEHRLLFLLRLGSFERDLIGTHLWSFDHRLKLATI